MQRNKKGQFVKGCVSWCKGTKGIIKSWNKGKNCPQLSGKNNGMFGVHRFGKDSPNFKFDISKEELYDLYWNKNLSWIKIGKIFGCSDTTIKNNLIKYNIPRKTISEACKGRQSSFKGKHHTEEVKKSQSKKMVELYKDPKNHPFFGKHHTENAKIEMSKQRKGRKLTNAWKQKIKEACQGINQGKNNGMFGKTPKYERIKYKNIWMRSNYEVNFAYFLDLSGIKYFYEFKTFNLGNTTYTPDFYIPKFNCYIEIKGYWFEGSKKRFDLFKQQYPQVGIKVLMKPELQSMGVLE